jgi:hypothetical protein
MGKKSHELVPSARRLISSLRDMGYDFPSAVADIVDNSIEANASKITIDVRSDGDDSWVRICDNGAGMKPAQIREALRYGASREYDQRASLGKFGLGLKTASMSQCQHLLVASRSSSDQLHVPAYAWDLAHILEKDVWEILEVGRQEHSEVLRGPLMSHTGTVVLWRCLDRILGFKHPYGGMIKKRIDAMCTELEAHLAMVFHRYLSGEAGHRKVRIIVNGKTLRPWDPFVRSESATQCLDPITFQYDHDGIKGNVILQAFVLPHQYEFSSSSAHAAAAGALRWNRQQGLYIYRADRMVQSGGWSNLRTLDEHTKLARVAVSFGPTLDEAFRINVAKMRVQIPRQLREPMEQSIGPAIKLAQVAYRRSQRKSFVESDSCFVRPEDPGAGKTQDKSTKARIPTMDVEKAPFAHFGISRAHDSWSAQRLLVELERIATKEEWLVLRSAIDRLLSRMSTDASLKNRVDDVSPPDKVGIGRIGSAYGGSSNNPRGVRPAESLT